MYVVIVAKADFEVVKKDAIKIEFSTNQVTGVKEVLVYTGAGSPTAYTASDYLFSIQIAD